jgi:HNH endonuclease
MAYPSIPLSTRFWANVRKTHGCWEWTASTTNRGYGRLRRNGSTSDSAHRISWELHFGKIPDGLCVLHDCDNRRCVRPDHLFLGTQLDNVRNMDAKNRRSRPKGSQNVRAKLTEADVLTIRACHAIGDTTLQVLASRYNVNKTAIWKIIQRKRWQHL